jgi:glycosyltransferase involved in cell wall biosynthesis
MPKISVLMPLYYKETSHNLSQCLESLAAQTLSVDEIVIVKDGVLPPELETVLLSWKDRLPLKIVGYKENRGLPYALNYGLRHCSNELVARMDSDDICLPDRFEKQINYYIQHEEIVLCSAYTCEFNEYINDILSVRKVPVGHNLIVNYLKRRNAFNHPAVVFKKSAILAVGGYQEISGFEDYDLWIRLVKAEFKVDNIPEVLVYSRIGNNMILRRRGFEYAKKEFIFLQKQRANHFISGIEFLLLLVSRIPLRFLPAKLLSFVYFYCLRRLAIKCLIPSQPPPPPPPSTKNKKHI